MDAREMELGVFKESLKERENDNFLELILPRLELFYALDRTLGAGYAEEEG